MVSRGDEGENDGGRDFICFVVMSAVVMYYVFLW